jgi:hypothetical protein
MKTSRRYLVILAFYALVAFVWLHQPLANASTHLTGDPTQPVTTDYYHFYWNYWWIGHAFSQGLDVYYTDYVFAPQTSNLALHTLTPLWYPLYALFLPIGGIVGAMNAVFFVALVLNGFVFHIFLERLGTAAPFALVGGVLLLTSEVIYVSLKWTTVNLIGWFWLPLVLMLWLNLSCAVIGTPSSSLQTRWLSTFKPLLWSAAIGITLWAMILTDLQYAVFLTLLIIPLALYTLLRALRAHTTTINLGAPLRLIAYGINAVIIALALLWLWGPLRPLLAYDRALLASTPVERAPAVAFPLGFIWRAADGVSLDVVTVPLFAIALLIFILRQFSPSVRRLFSQPDHTVLASPSPLLWRRASGGAVSLEKEQGSEVGFLFSAILALLLSAGGSIQLFGTTIPMPYQLLHSLLGGTFRYPERFTAIFIISGMSFALPILSALIRTRRAVSPLAVSSGLPLSQRYSAFGRRGSGGGGRAVPAVLLLLIYAESNLFASIPLQPIPTRYAFYDSMRREPYDYVVVEIPTAGASGEGIVGRSEWVAAQWYGITHEKRMINGHISRVPPLTYLYMETSDPMLSWLGQRRWLEPETVVAQMRERIDDWQIGYFVLHTQWLPQNGSTLQEILGFFNSHDDLVCPVWQEVDVIVYRTRWHPDGCPPRTPPQTDDGSYLINIGAADDTRYIGWGWHYAEPVGSLNWRWTGDYPRIGGDVVPDDGFLYADTYLDLPPSAYTLTLSAQAFFEQRQITVLVNGIDLGAATVMPDSLQPLTFTIPREAIGDGQHVQVRIAYDAAPIPAAIGQGGDPRRLAIAVDWLRFQPND